MFVFQITSVVTNASDACVRRHQRSLRIFNHVIDERHGSMSHIQDNMRFSFIFLNDLFAKLCYTSLCYTMSWSSNSLSKKCVGAIILEYGWKRKKGKEKIGVRISFKEKRGLKINYLTPASKNLSTFSNLPSKACKPLIVREEYN